jgi:hypothetical protein
VAAESEVNMKKALLALGTGLASAALAAPAALAQPIQTPYITDTLGGNGHPTHTTAQRNTFITDTLAPGGGPAKPVITVASPSLFSWADAGTGAGAAGGALIALAGGSLLVLRRRERLAI